MPFFPIIFLSRKIIYAFKSPCRPFGGPSRFISRRPSAALVPLRKYRSGLRLTSRPLQDTIQQEGNGWVQNLFLWEQIWTWLLFNDVRPQTLWHLWRSYTWEPSNTPPYNSSSRSQFPSIIKFQKTALCKMQPGDGMLQESITFICYCNLPCAKLPKCRQTARTFITGAISLLLQFFYACEKKSLLESGVDGFLLLDWLPSPCKSVHDEVRSRCNKSSGTVDPSGEATHFFTHGKGLIWLPHRHPF